MTRTEVIAHFKEPRALSSERLDVRRGEKNFKKENQLLAKLTNYKEKEKEKSYKYLSIEYRSLKKEMKFKIASSFFGI